MHRSLSEIIRFGMVGALATALHYGIYFLLWRYAGFNENIAYTVGYALSFVANFYLSAYFTFRSRPSWKRAGGFGGAAIAARIACGGWADAHIAVGGNSSGVFTFDSDEHPLFEEFKKIVLQEYPHISQLVLDFFESIW